MRSDKNPSGATGRIAAPAVAPAVVATFSMSRLLLFPHWRRSVPLPSTLPETSAPAGVGVDPSDPSAHAFAWPTVFGPKENDAPPAAVTLPCAAAKLLAPAAVAPLNAAALPPEAALPLPAAKS